MSSPLLLRALSPLLVVLALGGGCATAPLMRPMMPEIAPGHVDAGIAAHGLVGQGAAGAGTSAFVLGSPTQNFDLFARGHAALAPPYANWSLANPGQDAIFGAAVGGRWRFALSETLRIGAGITAEYLEQRSSISEAPLRRSIGFGLTLPVAEKAFDNFWIYVDANIGLAIALEPEPIAPFYGYMEMPIGIAWQVQPWLTLMAEGGYAMPLNGGMLSIGAAFRF